MQHHDTGQLLAWLAETDITLLELRGPGVHLCLSPHPHAQLHPHHDDAGIDVLGTPSAVAARMMVSAPSVGVFLHQHPLHEAPLAPPGARADAGQALGLLRIGSLLLPVCAPRAAMVATTLVAHGTLVGYGTPLIELEPLVEAG